MKKFNWEKFLQVFLVIFPITIGTILPILNLLNVFIFNKKVNTNMTTHEIIDIVSAIIVPTLVVIISVIFIWIILKIKNNNINNNNAKNLEKIIGTGEGENLRKIVNDNTLKLIHGHNKITEILLILKDRSDYYEKNKITENIVNNYDDIDNTIIRIKLKLKIDELEKENKTLKLENQKLSKQLENNDKQTF